MSCFQPNTIVSGMGTSLMSSLIYRSLKCMKLLIKASIFLTLFILLMPSVVILFTEIIRANILKVYVAQPFLQAGADVNGEGSYASPLVFATGYGGYTDFIKLLLKAGANPNIPDDVCVLRIS